MSICTKWTPWGRQMLLCTLVAWSASATAQHSTLPDTIAKVKPSVVIVGSYNPTAAPRFSLRGTGFVVGSGNWVVSNAHVLPAPGSAQPQGQLVVQVRTGPDSSQTRAAKVLDKDVFHDLTLLQIDGPPVTALPLADSDRVNEGQQLAFMGLPIGGGAGVLVGDAPRHGVVDHTGSAAFGAERSAERAGHPGLARGQLPDFSARCHGVSGQQRWPLV